MLDKFGWLHSAREMNGQYVLSERELYIGPGRPLGYHLMDGGRIVLVCDSLKGLLRVDRVDRSITILANEVAGVPLTYVNDLDVSGKGDVYFTSSTAGVVAIDAKLGFYDTMRSYLFNVLRGDATGALLKYDAATRTTRSLLGGLFFANGVALSAAEDFVAVVETSSCRVLRYWLRGHKAGSSDVLIDKLPGMPDGISRASDGHFWVSLVAPLTPLPKLLGGHPWLRTLVSHAVLALLPLVSKQWGCVVKVSADGEVLRVLLDPNGEVVHTVSAVSEHEESLFLGSLTGDFVSVVRV